MANATPRKWRQQTWDWTGHWRVWAWLQHGQKPDLSDQARGSRCSVLLTATHAGALLLPAWAVNGLERFW